MAIVLYCVWTTISCHESTDINNISNITNINTFMYNLVVKPNSVFYLESYGI